MINLIHAEFYKLSKSMAIKICFLAACASAAALVLISHGLAAGSINSSIRGSASGLSELVIISLLGSLLTGLLICSDFENKTIHEAVACSGGRSSIVISKSIMYIFQIVLLMLPYSIAAIIGFSTGADFVKPFVGSSFLGALYDSAGISLSAEKLVKITAVFIVTMLVHAARLSICIPLAYKLRKPIAITAIGFTYSALIDLILGMLKDVPLIGNLISITPYHMDFVTMSFDTALGMVIKAAVCSILFIILITLFTYRIFRRAEIK